MKQSMCVVALAVLQFVCAACAKNTDGFYKGDYYGVTWGMSAAEVGKVFKGKLLGEDDTWDREIIYEREENGAPAQVRFGFDRADTILRVVVLASFADRAPLQPGAGAEYFTGYTNRLAEKYGMWHESRVVTNFQAQTNADGKTANTETRTLRTYWSTSRTTVIAEAALSADDRVGSVRVTYTPTWK
jgi:hypothetical protein